MDTAGLSKIDALTKAIAAFTAIIALVTAYLGYRLKRAEARSAKLIEPEDKTSVRLLSVDYGPVKRSKWTKIKWVIVRWAMLVIGLSSAMVTAKGVYVFLFGNIASGLFSMLFFGACTYGYFVLFFQLRGDPTRWSSPVLKKARIRVAGEYREVFERCRVSLCALGAKIETLDLDRGRIGARTPIRLRSFGQKIKVRIRGLQSTECQITVSSDSTWPTTRWDLGKNRSNLQKFIDGL